MIRTITLLLLIFTFCFSGLSKAFEQKSFSLGEDFNDENIIEEHLDLLPEEIVSENFPSNLNEQVKYFVKYFSVKRRDMFELWLKRSGRYLPLIKATFRQEGLPEDLAYLAMIESGFNPFAYSRAGACGIWQFMRSTARKYGLRIDYWIDERRDPEKATRAAALYLSDLYSIFGDWRLACAAYNAGEGKITRAILRYRTRDYWELCRYRYLRRETKNYLPKWLAALIIVKNPEKFGFYITPDPPLDYEVVKVPGGTDLRMVALAAGVDFETIRWLNPELRRAKTPPYSSYPVRVPFGTARMAREYLSRVRFVYHRRALRYRVRRGDTLLKIASYYKVPLRVLRRANDLRGSFLRAGQVLVIPYREQASFYVAQSRKGVSSATYYRVRRGDTLWKISRRFGVPIEKLKRWNSLDSNVIRPGQVLVIWPEA
ncbi:transglycosylase SLT domain-containing protein [Thermosulfurimonas marina]|uniref:Transglycosylase SLT domain-containing protein n=1 Tax=Thermosulfurimonas marina TaxID=2047767 RepID=A0A6H1WQC4_9BACT|nr:lytic transglycosylase domain-containing protein [Thermosulfurimonas marina]QJA05359.1 transglycosylase SLT domain-containing protein [Thermosulfurimonas marina]